MIFRFFNLTVGGLGIYMTTELFYMWQANLNRLWQHYVRKERERQELMELVRLAQERGEIDPPEKGGRMV